MATRTRAVGGALLGLFLLLLLLLPSCMSRELYLERGKLAGLNRLALTVSSADLQVDYWKTDWAPLSVPGLISAAMDRQVAEDAQRNLLKESLDGLMRGVFHEEFIKKPECQLVDYPGSVEPQQQRQLRSQGFRAVVVLTLSELSLRLMTFANRLEIRAEVHGEMRDLETGQIIWSRRESAVSPESFPKENYTANHGELIWAVAEQTVTKATRRLAWDLVYAQ